jgi:putative colanic acid biosynthesis UDP-glucose lipid carrier transferase
MLVWIVSKFVLYPSVTERRYVSLEKVLTLGSKQLMLFNVIIVLLTLLFDYPIEQIFYELLTMNIIFIVSKTVFVLFLKLYRTLGFGFNRFITIGDHPSINEMIDYLMLNVSSGNQFIKHYSKVTNGLELKKFLLKSFVNEIYCYSKSLSNEDVKFLMSLSVKHDIHLHLVSEESFASIEINQRQGVFHNSELTMSPLMSRRHLILKRSFDLLISSFVIVFILSWLIPIIGLLIKIDSQGPVFFPQPRAGKNGVYFFCFKFRSMTIDADDRQASKNDSRVTRIGEFLRKTSLDEFPQFLNVFLGHMSIVGPRPHPKSLNDKYDLQVLRYNERLLVKPGITGLSQVAGYRGETIDQQTMQNRIRVDLLYIRSWSPLLDLRIFVRTFTKTLFATDSQAY